VQQAPDRPTVGARSPTAPSRPIGRLDDVTPEQTRGSVRHGTYFWMPTGFSIPRRYSRGPDFFGG
jgi:hypothetical protein